jgi:chromate transport protein ChrA
MWTIVGVFIAGCLGALIAGLVIVAASWREMMEQWDNE